MLIDNGRQLAMTVLAIRAILWTSQPKPYQRIHRSSNVSLTYPQILLDAADLSCNLRGIGWSWSRLPNLPIESRSFSTFFLHTLISFIFHLVLSDVTHRFAQLLEPNTIASSLGGPIFDSSLPPLHRYLRSTLITFFVGFTVYAGVQAAYLFFALVSLTFLRHSPSNGRLYSITLGFLLHFLNSGQEDGINSSGKYSFLSEATLLLSSWAALAVSSVLSSSPAFCTVLGCGVWVEEENSLK